MYKVSIFSALEIDIKLNIGIYKCILKCDIFFLCYLELTIRLWIRSEGSRFHLVFFNSCFMSLSRYFHISNTILYFTLYFLIQYLSVLQNSGWIHVLLFSCLPHPRLNIVVCKITLTFGLPRWCKWWRICLQMQEVQRDVGSIPGLGRSREVEHGSPLQYSCLENFMGGGAWKATVPGAAESQTWLSIHKWD